jgi:hypothetical protein
MMEITGQLMTRRTGIKAPNDKDGQVLVMLFGIVAVPEGSMLDTEAQQHTIMGKHVDNAAGISILPNPIDQEEFMRGMSVGGALTSPIWRC